MVPFLPVPLVRSQDTSVVFDNGVCDSEKWLTESNTSSMLKDPHCNNHLFKHSYYYYLILIIQLLLVLVLMFPGNGTFVRVSGKIWKDCVIQKKMKERHVFYLWMMVETIQMSLSALLMVNSEP